MRNKLKMRNFYLAFTALVIASLACSVGGTTPETAEPDVITIVVTATSEPVETETPTEEPSPTPVPPTATVIVDTATPELLHFYVSGVVWHDLCAVPDGPLPATPPDGCVTSLTGGLQANGIYEAGEPGIAGVTIKLEIDCSYGAFTTVTDASGNYSMSFTVPKSAGVSEQRICLSIDPLSAENSPLLIPGGWTYPANGTALVDIVIPVEQQNTINFGWDYQFQ